MALMSVENETQDQDHRSRPRWSANRKIDVVLRLVRGESLEDVSREIGIPQDAAGLGVAIVALSLFNYLQVRVTSINAVYARASERVVQALIYVEASDGEV